MTEIIKHINDTNASYRSLGAGNAKNTDLFLDAEHYEMFQGSGEQITVRFERENLTKAMLFIASILPRKYDNSSAHENIPFSTEFVYTQLAILNGFFSVEGTIAETRTQRWNLRKNIVKKNGEVDNRFYFNGLIEDITYTNYKGETRSTKFTIRNYLAGGYSDLHIKKANDGIFDVWITNIREPYNDNKGRDITYNIGSTQKLDNSSYLPYLTALRTKPFMLLAGISGTGKSRIVRELAFKSCPEFLQDQDGTTPGNYCMIEVKPNWHDSSDLLGYYSNIAEQYVFTDFIKFLVKAMMFPEVPFFVCLDEMNLAPVEQYFAEFLSVLETRKKTESGIKTGALVKAKYFENLPDADRGDGYIYTQWFPDIKQNVPYNIYTNPTLKTKGLGLPENVFVIGTVNMDDTTHQFSRKVLDRAMTIEMNGGKLIDMFGHSNDLEYLPEENVWKIDQFKPKYVNADEVLDEHTTEEEMLKTQLSEKLDAINDVLEGTPFVVSYRVLNELVIYAGVLLDDGKGMDEAINDAVDQITLMKILPRIEGDEDMLGNAKDENNRLCQLMKVVGPQSQAKLREMNRRLGSGFTRFWP